MNVNAEYNLEKLRMQLKDIEETLLGLSTPVEKLLFDENGDISEEKIKKFTDEVISHQCVLYGEYVGIRGADKRYIELLIYLIFRTYDPDGRVSNFSDLLEVAEELKCNYKSREEFILHDAKLNGNPLGFYKFGFYKLMHKSCKILCGCTISDDFTQEELEKMKEDYKKKSKLYRKKMTEVNRLFELTHEDKIEICKKYEDYGIEGETDVWDALDKEYEYKYGIYDLERLSGNQDDTDTAEVRRKRYSIFNFQEDEELDEKALLWKETFHNPKEYLDAFREFIELNFVVDVISGEHSLKDSILYILEKEGFNKMDDDVKFVSVYAELNKALRIARRKI